MILAFYYYIIITIIIIFIFLFFIFLLFWQFFTSELTDGFLLEFEWQQIFSSLQDSSQYSSLSAQCSSLDGLHSSSYF